MKNSWGTGWGQNGFGVVNKNNDCGLSAYAFVYSSNASPGNGVLFYNQVNLENGAYQVMGAGLLFMLFVMMVLGN